jgi:predicted nucleotidyltransferase
MLWSISRFGMVSSRGAPPPSGAVRRDLPIRLDRNAVAAFCRARGIRKLSLFGSVIRDDFDPRRSDVDVLAEFAPGVHPGLKFFGYGDELAAILGRKVDFNTPAWLSKYFRDQVLREAVTVYEQA